MGPDGICHNLIYQQACNKGDHFILVPKQNGYHLVVAKLSGNFDPGSGDIWLEDTAAKLLSRKYLASEKNIYDNKLPQFIGTTNYNCDIILRENKQYLGCLSLWWFAY